MTSGPPPRGVLEITAERDRIFMPSSIIRGASRARERAIEGTAASDTTRRPSPSSRGGIRVYRVTRHQISVRRTARIHAMHHAAFLLFLRPPLPPRRRSRPLRHKRQRSASPGMRAESILGLCWESRLLEARMISERLLKAALSSNSSRKCHFDTIAAGNNSPVEDES